MYTDAMPKALQRRGPVEVGIRDLRANLSRWLREVRSGREVEVDFRNGSRRVQMNADLEDGEIRVRVRERVQTSSSTSTTVGSDSTSTTVDDTGSPTSTAAGNATSTTVQDSSSTTADDDTTSTTIEDSTPTTVDDETTSTTIDDSTSTTMDDSDGPEEAGTESYAVGAAASVTIAWTNGQMTLVSVSVADGWSISDQDLRSDRVEIEFESGDREAEFRADFHHGTVRVETKVG